MFLSDKEDFDRWISSMHSYKYTVIGYAWKPVMFFVDVLIDTENNEKDDK